MAKATKIACLGQDRQCVDRAAARNLAKQLVIDMVGEPGMGKPFDLLTLVNETSSLREDHAELGDRG